MHAMQQGGVCWQEPQHSTSQGSLLYHWLQSQNAWPLQRDYVGGMHGQPKQHPKTLPLQASLHCNRWWLCCSCSPWVRLPATWHASGQLLCIAGR